MNARNAPDTATAARHGSPDGVWLARSSCSLASAHPLESAPFRVKTYAQPPEAPGDRPGVAATIVSPETATAFWPPPRRSLAAPLLAVSVATFLQEPLSLP